MLEYLTVSCTLCLSNFISSSQQPCEGVNIIQLLQGETEVQVPLYPKVT